MALGSLLAPSAKAFLSQTVHGVRWRKIGDLKPLTDAIVSGPVYVAEWEKDLALAKEVIDRDTRIVSLIEKAQLAEPYNFGPRPFARLRDQASYPIPHFIYGHFQ